MRPRRTYKGRMNAPALIAVASAYQQLRPAEKAFVDACVAELERIADRNHERISAALYRPIPTSIAAGARGMLDSPIVVAAITERINHLAAASELSVMRIVREYMAIGFSNLNSYMEVGEDGQPRFDLAKCTPEQLAAVKSIEIEESFRGSRKFKFTLHDKLGGLEKLARYVGMLEPDNPHWRAENAKPVGPASLPETTSVETAGDLYAQMING